MFTRSGFILPKKIKADEVDQLTGCMTEYDNARTLADPGVFF